MKFKIFNDLRRSDEVPLYVFDLYSYLFHRYVLMENQKFTIFKAFPNLDKPPQKFYMLN